MRTIEVTVYSAVQLTERVDRVVLAIENIFPGLIMDIRTDRIDAYDGPQSLRRLHRLLRSQEILDAARSVLERGQSGNIIHFQLSKQAAYMGMVSFPPQEEPLGSLHIQIQATDPERVIDWLAPVTENGVAVEEIDLFEGTSDSVSNSTSYGAVEEDV
ncbi:RNA-binding domain-containing protein [Methanothrix sp.]|jgi:predicted RNA binding protein with dsRBD fold (UPF0201 family)|uniref:RNA-binding domain-containing protein n=1 Tax=Methanothrix sp. TaxID=90426 RepID=UPI003BB6A045